MKKLILHLSLIFIALTSTAFSQEISADKKVAIDEIIVVTKAEDNMKKVMSAMFEQMDAMYPSIVESIISTHENLTPTQKEEMKTVLIAKNADFSKKFNQRFLAAIDFPVFVKDVYYPIYDKFFTTQELKDLAAFYKSPTGQKFNTIMPEFSGESMRLTQIYLLPKIDGIMKGIVDDEIKSIELKSSEPPPAKQN